MPAAANLLPIFRRQVIFSANGLSFGEQRALRQPLGRIFATFEAGENKSGHISAGPNEGIFFFDNIFPLRLQWLARIPFINLERSVPELLKRVNNPDLAAADPMTVIHRALPDSLPIRVSEIIPRIKEGGAFVKFCHDGTLSQRELETSLKKYLKEHPIKPWFNPLRRVRAFLVQGRPWIEDLYRVPSSRLKVEFLGPSPEAPAAELTQEALFSLFRCYGKIADIVAQPSDSKIVPRYAMVDYTRVRFAVMAKNCMHGFKIPPEAGGGQSGTVLKISFQQKAKSHWIRDWLFSHPRIVIPAVAALVAAVTVAIFDPIRTFFIKSHITQAFHLEGNMVGRWVRNQMNRANDIFRFGKRKQGDESLEVLFEDRQGAINQIKTWLIETADTFIVVQGPRGSGKRTLVLDQAVEDRKYKLVIDCKPIQEARGDSATIGAAAAEVSYKPVFSWLNSISSLVDLAAQGTIGTKTGFSETLDTQLAKIWSSSATALKQIALSGRKNTDKDADLTDDEYLEAHPERRPVVIIDNFLHKANESSLVYDKIAEWAAALTTTNIAHVIFLTSDVSFSKSLSKALPDRVFRQVVLSDCSPETAKRFVLKQLEIDADDVAGEQPVTETRFRSDLHELDETINTLGGRLTDLQFLARRIRTGESPKRAVQEIIEQSASEILKMFILDVDVATRRWTPQQAWLLISKLADVETLRYNEVLLSDIYKDGGESTLQALENAELINIASSNGRPHAIRPGKPVYLAAFRYLTQDQVLRSRMDLAIYTQLIGIETKNIEKYENELKLLQEANARPNFMRRVQWLLGKADASQYKVEEYERESAKLKKTLMASY